MAAWFSTRATLENTFLESTARIQSDRKQTVCMTITVVIVIIRTALEDKMLKEGLDGYLEYTGRTKFKLIPFIW